MLENSEIFIGYDKYRLGEFEFESGEVLNDVVVEFSAKGTPKFDDEGNITNAIVYCHNFDGNYSSIGDIYKLTGEGSPLDLNEYYFISITSLGFPDSCSPSTTNLKHNFPKYTIKDCVDFKRKFLKECMGISNVFALIGRGVGGYEVYTWICEYPDEMEMAMIVGSSYKTNGYRYVISKCMESIIESTDDFYSDIYSDSLSRVMVSINKLLYSNYFSKKQFQSMSKDEIDIFMDDFVDDGLFIDIYDFKYRNDAILYYDVSDKLKNIKTRVLVVSSSDDFYYTPEFDTLPLKNLIDDVTVCIFESDDKKVDYNDGSLIESQIQDFMNGKNKKE